MGVYYWIYNHDLDEQIDLGCCTDIKCGSNTEGEDSKDVGLEWLEHLMSLGKLKEYLSAVGYISTERSAEEAQTIADRVQRDVSQCWADRIQDDLRRKAEGCAERRSAEA